MTTQLSTEFVINQYCQQPEKDLSSVDQKSEMRKVRTSSVKSPSALFSC